ncbi:MAG: ParB/RepB/Spo0J family partition protein [Lentisphaerae bacterium]|nr:ParB/RepB/Spo0J family partition protein [Lentisphaerota bacterium]
MSKEKIGASSAAPVGNATGIETKKGPRSADVSLRDLAASIGAHAEAHKSEDPGWSKVKSAADAVRNGVKSEIARLISEFREIDDPAAKGFQAELSVLVAGKKTGALKTGNVIASEKVAHALPKTAVAPSATSADNPGKIIEHPAAPGNAALQCFSVAISKLQPHPRVKGKFNIDAKEFAALKANMAIVKFDPRHPIIVVSDGKGGFWVADGLSRLRAALELGITDVFIMVVEFGSDEELDYFIATTQLLRRECTDAVLLTAAAIIIPIEERKAKEERQGARNELATSTHEKVKVPVSTSDAVGLILHRSGSTVDKIKKILANPEYSRKVKADEIKIAGAYREIMAAQRPTKPAKTDKPADTADDGDQTPMGSKAADENKGKTAIPAGDAKTGTVEPDTRDAGKQNADAQQDAKAPVADAPRITRQADDETAVPAIQDNTVTLFPVPEKLLAFLLTFAPESSRQKIYGLLTGCPRETRDFIKKQLGGIKEPSLRKTQGHPNPKDKLTLGMSKKRKHRHHDGTA